MISKLFIKSSLIYSIVGSLPYISGVILIPFFTSKLTTEDFGINALYFSIIYFIQIISTFGIETYIGIHYFEYKDNKQKLKENIGTAIISLFAIGAFIITILSIFGNNIFILVFHNASLVFWPWGFIIMLTAIFNGFLRVYSSLLINQQRPERFFKINSWNFILVISFSLFFLYTYPFTLNGPMYGRLIPSIISFCTVLYYMLKEFGIKFNKEMISKIISFCTPFVIYSLLIWSISYIDRFIIVHYLIDPTFVGIFDFTIKCTLFIELFQTGLANTISPKIYSIWKENNISKSTPEVNRYYNGFTAVSLLIIPLFSLAFPYIIPLVIKNSLYYQSFIFFGILAIGFAFRGLFNMFLAPIFYFKKTKVLPKIYTIIAIFQITLTILMIKYFGLIGAIWANLLVKIIQAFALYSESRKIFEFKFNKTKLIFLPLISTIIVILFETIVPLEYFLYSRLCQFFIIYLLVFSVYKKDIIQLPIIARYLNK